ncbi:MAG: hypothetical protein ACO3JG_12345 [Luteolibacter sp.]
MRTTIDFPDELFREAKTRAVQQGTTLKSLVIQYVRSGLSAHTPKISDPPARRSPPPVAIRRIPGQASPPAFSNRELHALLEQDEVHAAHQAGTHHPSCP